MKLTNGAVNSFLAGSKDAFLWDTALPGFGVRARPSGRKTYVLRYRTMAGTSRYYTIARTADMDVATARAHAQKLFVQIRGGFDPAANKAKAKAALSCQELYELWQRVHVQVHCKPSYAYVVKGLWKNHLRPHLGRRRVSEITRADVQAIQERLAGHHSVANSAVSVLGSMFRLAVDRELVESSPVERVKWLPVRKRAYVLSPEEIRRLLAALDDPSVFPSFALLVRLLLITGCRLREIMCARVEWIDWDRRLLCLPDTKTGQREIALSDAALALLEPAKARAWVIPGRYGHGHMKHVGTSWARVKKLAGLPVVVRLHDLRHTVGSLSHAAGLSQKEIAIQLGHRRLSTTERYLSGFRGEHHDIAERVSAVLGGAKSSI